MNGTHQNDAVGSGKIRFPTLEGRFACLAVGLIFCGRALAAETNAPPDLSRPTLYEIGYSHLDTEWRWTYPQVIGEFIPNTVRDNLPLFQKYPHYVFNWTGAGRYQLLKEYFPDLFEKVREETAAGRWWPTGSSWEENDVNVPSSESIIRQLLLGHEFFKKEFGVESSDYILPDCFGFPASLPSILAHCGIRGFSTQKLTWGSAVGIPFNVGEWIGPDGHSVIAALNPGGYGSKVRSDRSHSARWLERLEADGAKSGVFADYAYFGAGDRGGAPDEESVRWIEKSVTSDGPVRVICARGDEMFRDITDAQKARLPRYQGDLLLTEHSTGSLTSEAYMKRWNHENELLADAAERASVAAWLLGAAPYPRQKLDAAWELVLRSQMHDMLPGTCIPKAYEYIWNDEVIAMNSFADALQNAVGAVARGLDTRTEGSPLVVYNPLSIARQDVVEAEVELPGAAGAQVYDGAGRPVPTQWLSDDNGQCHFLFLAKAPPVGFAVYSVKASAATGTKSPLKVDLAHRLLENVRYRVTLNAAGDIAGIYDKAAGRELLSAPARLEFLTQNPDHYPAWNMRWADQSQPPRGHVGGPAKFSVVENGPVRVAIQVRREAEHSTFVQTIRLAAGNAGDHVEVENQVAWESKACSLKAAFPLNVSNALATYNWELGKVERGNDDLKKFEVPSHEWFDLTDKTGDYGVSILCPDKYGSNKPADNVLRLTLLYTPGIKNANGFHEQRWQDWGRHEFVYGIYGHPGDWRQGRSDWQAARLDQPMFVFQTGPHAGKLGRHFSLLRLDSDRIAIRAIKLAEDSNRVIVRLQELNGAPENAVRLTTTGVAKADEVNGLEEFLHPLKTSSGGLTLDFTPYQLRSIALTLKSPLKLSPPVCVPVALPYNLAAFGFRDEKADPDFDGAGSAIPAEMIGDTVTDDGVTFQIGPRAADRKNAVACEGQTIRLPDGRFNRLYLLAASVHGDTEGDFSVDGRSRPLRIQNWTGYIGSWDNRVFEGDVPELSYNVTNRLERIDAAFIKRAPLAWYCDHRRLADGGDAIYSYSYLFKYGLDIPAGAKTLTLPNNPGLRVLAVTLAEDDDDTRPAHPLYDDFANRKPIALSQGWANSQ
ncbi:MAG: alpha-mannosidase [Verrucomicrobiota bacterium]|nr:alpha-mannosidase [Verrucomicrobiota bacterium]